MNPYKTSSFARYVDRCAVALLRARLNVQVAEMRQSGLSWVRKTETEVRADLGIYASPRLARAVSLKLRDLACRSHLDAVDSLALLEARLPQGGHNLHAARRRRPGLRAQHPLWVVGELRDQRLERFAERHETESSAQERSPARAERRSPQAKEAATQGDVLTVFVPPKEGATRRDDDDLKRYRAQLSEPKALHRARDRHHLDEMIASVHGACPWMRAPLEWVWRHNITLFDTARPRIEIPPLLLIGPPGAGKTFFAERLCEVLGLVSGRIDMSGRSAAFDIAGIEFAWRSAHPGQPVRTLAVSPQANPALILDEVDKAGRGGNGGSPLDALLPLLQRETARRFACPYLQSPVDLSWISWIATANDRSRIPGPVLDRFRVFDVAAPTGQDLREMAERLLTPAGAERAVIAEACRQLDRGRMSLRGLTRLAAEITALRTRPTLH